MKYAAKRIFHNISIALFCIGFIGLFIRSLYRPVTPDEIEGLHTGFKIFQGQRIYTDFFQHHHPLTFYLWAGLIKVVGQTVSVIRIARFIQFLFFSGMLFFLHRLGTLIFSTQAAWAGLVLLLSFTFYTPCAIDIRPDIAATFFVVAAFYYFFSALYQDASYKLVLSGIALAAAFLCIQKTFVFVLVMGALLLYNWYQKQLSIKDLLLYACASGLPVALYVLYVLLTNQWHQYFVCNVLFNAQLVGGNIVFILKMFFESLQENAAVWTFSCIGMLLCTTEYQKQFTFLVLSTFVMMIAMCIGFPHYYMPCSVLMALLAGYGFVQSIDADLIRSLILIGFTIGQLVRPYSCWYKKPNIKDDMQKIEYVHAITPPGHPVYSLHPCVNLFRPDLHYVWFSPMNADQFFVAYAKPYDLFNLLEQHKPPIIGRIAPNLKKHPFIVERYATCSIYSDLLKIKI